MKLIDERGVDYLPGRVTNYRAVWSLGNGYCELTHCSSQSCAYIHLGDRLDHDNCGWPFVTGIYRTEWISASETWAETKEMALTHLLEIWL